MAFRQTGDDVMKLTQSQRAVLASACNNELGFVTRPTGNGAGQVDKIASALIEKGLVKEIRARAGGPVWRKDEQGRDYALKILKGGRDAVDSHENAGGASKDDVSGSTIQVEVLETLAEKAAPRRSTQDVGAPSAKIEELMIPVPRAGSKQAMVIAMLREQGGATLQALVAATGWLPHTTRAALTGLRKKGFEVQLERPDGSPSIYRITKEPSETAA